MRAAKASGELVGVGSGPYNGFVKDGDAKLTLTNANANLKGYRIDYCDMAELLATAVG